jgi:hypothetical protein
MQSFSDEKSQALYQQALVGQWDPDVAVDWSRMSFDRLAKPIRSAMAAVYADVLYAEDFGVRMITRMVELAPEGWQRDFAVLQLKDEARHAVFFGRVLDRLGGCAEVSPHLIALRAELERITDYDELVLHGQIIETAARVIFVANGHRTLNLMGRSLRLPGSESVSTLVHAIVELIGRDESRHIAFGLHCLRQRLAGCDASQLHALEGRALVSARLMHGAFASRTASFRSLGWEPTKVLSETWDALRTQLGRLEFDIGEVERVEACEQ